MNKLKRAILLLLIHPVFDARTLKSITDPSGTSGRQKGQKLLEQDRLTQNLAGKNRHPHRLSVGLPLCRMPTSGYMVINDITMHQYDVDNIYFVIFQIK